MRRGPYADARTGLEPAWLSCFRNHPTPSLDDCLVEQDPDAPWLLKIWEPLPTKAPAPPKASPHCCYRRSVIFYHSPYITARSVRGWRDKAGKFHRESPGFVEWDNVEYRLTWNDRVRFGGDTFEIGGGWVVWARRRWWLCHDARRVQPTKLAVVA